MTKYDLSYIAALDPVTGQQRWRLERPGVERLANTSLYGADSTTIYATALTAANGRPQTGVFAFDAVTGERKWATYFPSVVTGPPTAGDGVLCLTSMGAGQPELIALDAQSGARKWIAPGPSVPFAGGINDGVVAGTVANTASKSGLSALDVRTGKPLWTTNADGNVWNTVSDAGTMYTSTFGSAQGTGPGDLIALDTRTGKTRWKRHFPEGPPTHLEPTGAILYTGNDGGAVLALDSATGRLLWSHKLAEGPKDGLTAVVPTPGALCLASFNGGIVALHA